MAMQTALSRIPSTSSSLRGAPFSFSARTSNGARAGMKTRTSSSSSAMDGSGWGSTPGARNNGDHRLCHVAAQKQVPGGFSPPGTASFRSPERAKYDSPGQRPGKADHSEGQALKGRNNILAIAPFQGLA